jgi:hypothetical protein
MKTLNARAVRILVAVAISGGLIMTGLLTAGASSSNAPTHPPYVLVHGKPDLNSLPGRVPIIGRDGSLIATVPRGCLFDPDPDNNPQCAALPRPAPGEGFQESTGATGP